MADPKPGGRWDGWDDPDYTPTQTELEEPIPLEHIEDATPEDRARVIPNYKPPRPVEWPDP